MTPAGHAAIGYLAGRSSRRLSAAAFVAGSLLPDLDFLLLPLPVFNGIHRGATHSLVFFLAAGCIAAAIARHDRARAGLCVFLGALLHALVDACMDSNPTNGIGVAFLWPFTGATFSPFNLAAGWAPSPGWDQPTRMFAYAWRSLAIEIPFYLAALYLLWNKPAAAR